jgi:hypothetical protein
VRGTRFERATRLSQAQGLMVILLVALAPVFIGKQAEEQEHVTNPDAHIAEVRLSRTTLAEQALTTREHRVFVAKRWSRAILPRVTRFGS